MLKDQRGNIVYWVLSGILAIAVIFLLVLSIRANLDPKKNADNCITSMQKIWVAVRDYVTDTQKDFDGNLNVLRNTQKPNSKSNYLGEEKYCPESRGKKDEYMVMGRLMTYEVSYTDTTGVEDVVRTSVEKVVGIMVLCPNLKQFSAHDIPQAFYDNQIANRFQSRINSDIAQLKERAGNNPLAKYESMLAYFNFWKNTKLTDFDECTKTPEYRKIMNISEPVEGEETEE